MISFSSIALRVCNFTKIQIFHSYTLIQKQPLEVLCEKKGVFKNFTSFTGKKPVLSRFNKIAVFLSIIKKRLQHRCFPVKYTKFLRTTVLKKLYEWLLLLILITLLFVFKIYRAPLDSYFSRVQAISCSIQNETEIPD